MATAAPPISGKHHGFSRDETRVIFASSLGTVFEWYDFYLYAVLAPFFAAVFFPSGNATAALLSAFATYAAGFLVRPFGALVFGRIGDLVGRKYTFLVTIMVMGLSTAAVGMLPTYATVGMLKLGVGRQWPNGGADPSAPDRLEHPERSRDFAPFQRGVGAWPSGHTAVMFAGAAAFRASNPELGVWSLAGYPLALGVASGMWLADHHWASDIVSGALALIELAVVDLFFDRAGCEREHLAQTVTRGIVVRILVEHRKIIFGRIIARRRHEARITERLASGLEQIADAHRFERRRCRSLISCRRRRSRIGRRFGRIGFRRRRRCFRRLVRTTTACRE